MDKTEKIVQNHQKIGEITWNLGGNHQKFDEIHPKFDDWLVILGCFGEPQMLESAKWYIITGPKPLWDPFFGTPKRY